MTLSGHFRAGGVHQTNVCPKSSNREHKNHIPTYETMAKRFCLLSLFTLQYLFAFGSRSQYLAVPAMSGRSYVPFCDEYYSTRRPFGSWHYCYIWPMMASAILTGIFDIIIEAIEPRTLRIFKRSFVMLISFVYNLMIATSDFLNLWMHDGGGRGL